MEHIILTSTQASRVRGISAPQQALDPIALTDGTFALPLAVLTADAHAKHYTRLAALPRRTLTSADFKWVADEAARQAIKR